MISGGFLMGVFMDHSLHELALKCVSNCRKSDSELIEVLSKIDSTRLYLEMGDTSLFAYCVKLKFQLLKRLLMKGYSPCQKPLV